MKKETYFYITAIVAVLIVVLAGFIFINLDLSDYKYSVEREGVRFVSNSAQPSELLSEMRNSKTFIISPQFVEIGSENTYMVSTITLFSTVLIAKGKDVIVVGRVLDEKGNLIKCQTNLGNVKTNEELSVEKCNQLLSDNFNTRIFISFPTGKTSLVELEPRTIKITPSSFTDISHVSFVVAKALYEDAEQIIEQVNILVDRL
ncbi:MAG: hypothetical protein NUV57_01655 [archaeon]|nr:hypothetical protein [archaeon]